PTASVGIPIRRSGAFRAWSRARRLSPGVTAAGLRAVWWSLAAGTGAGPGPARGVPHDHHDHVGSAPPGRPGVLRRERRGVAAVLRPGPAPAPPAPPPR